MKKCLIVDDVAVSLYTARLFIEELGLEVETSGDSKSAIAVVESFDPDVILMDWHLKKESGIELVKKIKAKYLPNVKIIMFSGVESEDKKGEAKSAGADGFIEKPTTKDKLEVELRRIGIL